MHHIYHYLFTFMGHLLCKLFFFSISLDTLGYLPNYRTLFLMLYKMTLICMFCMDFHAYEGLQKKQFHCRLSELPILLLYYSVMPA